MIKVVFSLLLLFLLYTLPTYFFHETGHAVDTKIV